MLKRTIFYAAEVVKFLAVLCAVLLIAILQIDHHRLLH